MKRTFVFYLHSFAGLLSGLFILLMSVSGAMLVFHDDLDALQQPKISSKEKPAASVNRLFAAVKHAFPGAQVSNCVLPENNTRPVSFFIYDSSYKYGTAALEVFLHPQTAEVLTTRGGSKDIRNNFMSWLSRLHSSLHLGKTGEWLLGFFALVFLISILSGLYLYRKNIPAVLLFKKSVYRRANLHQVVGVYALLFNLVIAVTGCWMQRYVFKKEFYASYDYAPVLKASATLPYSFDAAYAELRKQYPDFTGRVIYFAQGNQGNTAVYGSRSSNACIHSKKFADVVFLDSAGAVVKTRFINEIDAADRYDIINSQLHMGKYGGTGIKLVYFLFGLSSALLSITGFLLWVKRRKK